MADAAPGARRLALKVDCDTFEGTRAGIPTLLRLLDERRIRASFFFTLGPDRSGRAITRIVTRKGFLRKMLRSRAVSLYGPRTMLYGTILPAPLIGERLADTIRSVGDAGHEVGVHGWDHVRWHDRLDRLSRAQIEHDYDAAHRQFESIFGRRAHSSAAPGWHVTAAALAIAERYDLLYASNTRGDTPFFPSHEDRRFRTLEIPTTLPTWDETLNAPEFPDDRALIDFYRRAIRRTEVHSIHTEVEGTAHAPLFARQLDAWLADGVHFMTLEEIARESLSDRTHIPTRHLVRVRLPGRAGEVTAGECR